MQLSSAPEIFLFLAVAIGTILGRIRIRGFAIGATACILIVAVVLGQLGTFVFPPCSSRFCLACSCSLSDIVLGLSFLPL